METQGQSANGRSAQDAVTRTYDRIAAIYDIWTQPMEWFGLAKRRRRLLARAAGRVLEVGAGTGRSFDYYPPDVELVATDISPKMLARARRRAQPLARDVLIEEADVQRLAYADGAFDTVTACCVFCSVPDPVAGLRELQRVVKQDGRVLLLEHVRPRNPLLGLVADAVSPLTRRLFGPELNRRTEENAVAAGLELVDVRRSGIWREIEAGPARPADATDAPAQGAR